MDVMPAKPEEAIEKKKKMEPKRAHKKIKRIKYLRLSLVYKKIFCDIGPITIKHPILEYCSR
jgi:hypothetical protein